MTLAVLERGDKVIATARGRSISKLDDLEAQGADILELDVTSSLDSLHEFAKKAINIHGHVDVLVNNAGYMDVAALEEFTYVTIPTAVFNDGTDLYSVTKGQSTSSSKYHVPFRFLVTNA